MGKRGYYCTIGDVIEWHWIATNQTEWQLLLDYTAQ